MNKIFAPFLPPWAETGLQPAFYDVESGTVLQQTARMYNKVNQLTRLFNEFSEATSEEVNAFEREVNDTVDDYIEKFNALKDYVEDYFENLDVQEEINNKLDEMALDGTLADIIENHTSLPQLQEDVSNLQTDMTAVKNANCIKQTEMVVIGDSYSSRTYLANPHKLWCEIVAEREGLTLHNFADSGSGFTTTGGDHGTTFSTAIDAAYADSSFDNDKVKYVFFYGGTNDVRTGTFTTTSALNTAIDNTFSNLKTKFPNAKLVYLGCDTGKQLVQKAVDSSQQYITETYIDFYIKNNNTIKGYGITFADMTFFYTGMEEYFVDGINYHPNYIGHIQFAEAVNNALHGSGNAFMHMVKATPSLTSGSSSNWSLGNTINGENIFQYRFTNHSIDIALLTCAESLNNASSFSILLPLNVTIPYSTQDDNPYTSKYSRCNCVGYITSHIAENIKFEGNTLVSFAFGMSYITFNKVYSVASILFNDIGWEKHIEF
mgnify:CR=1 FL=1